MTKLLLAYFFLFLPGAFCYSQSDEVWLESTNAKDDTTVTFKSVSESDIHNYLHEAKIQEQQFILGGYVSSIFHEQIDSAKIFINIPGCISDSLYTENGLFRYILPDSIESFRISLSITHPDYHSLDTIVYKTTDSSLVIRPHLKPLFKILLRGRIYSGNLPLEGVEVEINHSGKKYKMLTLGCYFDKEDYWNCLYNGMFKQELVADTPRDSIHIHLSKEGLKPINLGMTFSDYTGDIMQFRMKYTSRLPEVPINYISLKLAFPFTSLENDWNVSLSYYRLLQLGKFNRLAVGADLNFYISTITVEHSTFPGLANSEFDSSYISSFLGPGILFWLNNPNRRWFATYIGSSFTLKLNTNEFVPQPFLGTRIMLDFNKSLNIEAKYAEYNMDIASYAFNPYGNAYRTVTNQQFEKLFMNIGIQVQF